MSPGDGISQSQTKIEQGSAKMAQGCHPMASAADIAGALAFASMSFGITFERSEPVVIERSRRIDSGESRRVFAASFHIEFVVETFLGEIALFVGDPVVEPAMRLNNEFRHIVVSTLIICIAMLRHDLARLQIRTDPRA
jgi:hypothetical protein